MTQCASTPTYMRLPFKHTTDVMLPSHSSSLTVAVHCSEARQWEKVIGEPLSLLETVDPAAFQSNKSKITKEDGGLAHVNKPKSTKNSTRKKRKKQQLGIIMTDQELISNDFRLWETMSGIDVYRSERSVVCPLHCTRCGKRFRSRSEIRMHINTHVGKKPYKCEHCPSAFANRANLRTHRCNK